MNDVAVSPLRKWRLEQKLSLDAACDLFSRPGYRPSPAKLSRMERGQEIPRDMLSRIHQVTKIPAKELCPELVETVEQLLGGDQ